MKDLRKGERGLTLAERIEKYTDQKKTPKGCKLWLGGVTTYGYPCVGVEKGKGSGLVHLQLARFHNILKPFGGYVMTRTCKNKLCVNYLHLQWRLKRDVSREVAWRIHKVEENRKKKAAAKKPSKRYTCKQCGVVLSAWYTNKKFCSNDCLKASHVGKLKNCVVCKKDFNAPVGRPSRIICSDQCRLLHLRLHVIKVFEKKSYRIYFKKCAECGKWFYSHPEQRKRLTCSEECYKLRHRMKMLKYSLRCQAGERTLPYKKDTGPRENVKGHSIVAHTGDGM